MKLRVAGLCGVLFLCTVLANAFSLDREAFTFTNYDLNVQVEPAQQRLGARGKITLRNDSQAPQKIAVLQISSSLNWRSIKSGDKPLQFVTQPYTSDVDHTGSLSEVVVTLREPVAPKGSIEIEISYEGVIVLDAARLTRIGTPEGEADSSDWDQITGKFTAVRGVGHVAWYPIATEAANLSEGSSVFEVLGRWKAREAESSMHLQLELMSDGATQPTRLLVNKPSCVLYEKEEGSFRQTGADCVYGPLGLTTPAFFVADYGLVERPSVEVFYLPGHDVAAATYADAAEKAAPFISDWFGALNEKAKTADLADPSAAPFESGSLLLIPLSGGDSKLDALAAAHQLAHAAFSSPRPWINEGLAHFAQALYLEQQKGRQAALDYMGLHRSAFGQTEKQAAPRSEDESGRSLVNTTSEELYRSKAMYVWWMLRDMIGEAALKKALAAYHAEQDKEPTYMPRLIAAQNQRDLEWFFHDWVYRDRGLPDFRVESAIARKTLTDSYLVTVSIENLGGAGAEVPVAVKFTGGEISKRIEVHAKSRAVFRVEVPAAPHEVVVNDGSVPESDMGNNVFRIEAVADQH